MDSGLAVRARRNDSSERNLIVHLASPAAAATRAGCGRDFARRPGRTEITARVIGAEFTAATTRAGTGAASAVEQRQLAAKTLQHHFGRIAVLAGLILPFARLQRALDENF
jgi:hypothetical protein